MSWSAAPRARCAEHGLTLDKHGRCALCRGATGRAARRSGHTAALAAVACALTGAAIAGGRAVLTSSSDDDARPPAAAATRASARPRTETDRSSFDAPRPERARIATAHSRAVAAEPAASESAVTSAEDQTVGALVPVPLASRHPAPIPPDAPAPPLDLETPPAADDPGDFELRAEPPSTQPWVPPL